MTSTFAPFGFRRTRTVGSGNNTAGMDEYRIANGLVTNIFYGDPVKMSGNNDGTIVAASVSTDWVVGVFQGCYWMDPVSQRPTWSSYFPSGTSSMPDPARGSTQPRAMVIDDARACFEVQAAASVTVGAIGINYSVSLGSGSTRTGFSAAAIAPAATGGANGLAMCRVIDIVDTPDNTFTDAYPILVVRFAQHQDNRVSAG